MPYRLFVDANLWYPPSTRALIMGIAIAGAAETTTSEQVLNETYRHLHKQIPEAALSRVEAIRNALTAIDAASVVDLGNSDFDVIGLPDPNDEHVVAGALLAEADGILTSNVKDFPEDLLEGVGLELVDVDKFFGEPLQIRNAEWVRAVELALTFPPAGVKSACDLGLALTNFGLERTAGALMSASW